MIKHTLLAILLLAGASSAYAQTCLHGPGEKPADRTRREQALQLATKIHLAEMGLVGPRSKAFRPFSELTLPTTPPGFHLQFHADTEGYAFSIKDTLDSCHYAI